MVSKLSITNLPIKGKRVLMRVDFNVPLVKTNITDDTRILAALPSIKFVLDNGGSLILMSHLGRPKSKPSPEFSLKPCAVRLSELLNIPVIMAPDCIGDEVEALSNNLKAGQILLLENLRFHNGEEHPEEDPAFAKQLAKLGDVYVNDAFGTAHRAHASTTIIAKYFPDTSAAGFLMEKEIKFLDTIVYNPPRPFYAIIGGAKIGSKIGILRALLDKVDALLIGGGMAYTFFKAQGLAIGNSIHDDEMLEEAKNILDIAKAKGVRIYLPKDNVIVDHLESKGSPIILETKLGIPESFQGVDIGPSTISEYIDLIQDAKTLFWNGPLGIFEIPAFAKGTTAIAIALAKLSDTITIVGGGESVAAVETAGVADKITHLSTGGGASLEYLEQGTLPGIDALTNTTKIK